MGSIYMDRQTFMRLPLSRLVFDTIFEIKKNAFQPVLVQYRVSQEELYDLLWEKLNVPDMDVRTANTAMDFLIDCCERKKDLAETINVMLHDMILASAVYYTNIAPDAVSTSDGPEKA